MEWVGVVALLIILCYSSYPAKVKRLTAEMKRIQKKQKGESGMSKIISELVGTDCKIKSDAAFEILDTEEVQCHILDADDEWIKIQFKDKKGKQIVKIIRIDNIDEIEMQNL